MILPTHAHIQTDTHTKTILIKVTEFARSEIHTKTYFL